MGGELVLLKDIVRIKGGKRLPKGSMLQCEPNEHPYIRVRDMGNKFIPRNGLEYVPEDVFPKIKNYIVEKNDVIVSIVGSVGLVSVIDEHFHLASQTENCAKLSGLDKADAEYLYYCLTSPSGQREIAVQTVGAVQPKLPLYGIENIQIPWPDQVLRHRIANILGTLDDKIELNRQMNATLEAMAQALFKSWFVDFDPVIDNALAAGNPIPEPLQSRADARKALGNKRKPLPEEIRKQFPSSFVFSEEMDGWVPEGWEVKTIGDVIELAYGKSLPATERIDGDVPVFGSGGISGYHNEKFVDGPGIIVGRKGTVGSLYWVEEGFFPIDTVFFVVNKSHAPLYWLYQKLGLIDIKSMGADSAVPGVNRNAVYARSVTIPSEGVCDGYLGQIESYNSRRKVLDKQSSTLSKLRDTLLPKLLSGQLRIPEAEAMVDQVAAG